MRNRCLKLPTCLVAIILPGLTATQARDLTFQERVDFQRAIERVYYSHQAEATLPFEEAVPRAILSAKVRGYLAKSALLDAEWHTPITAEMLRAELARIARDTRYPDRLREIYAALHNDSFLVQECFARPVLADRLARNFFSTDERIHRPTRTRMEELRRSIISGRQDIHACEMSRTVVEAVRASDSSPGDVSQGLPVDGRTPPAPRRLRLDADAYEAWRSHASKQIGDVGLIEEERDGFVVRVVLEEDAQHARIAEYRTSKTTWDAWLSSVEEAQDLDGVRAVASETIPLPPAGPGGPVPGNGGASNRGSAGPVSAETSSSGCVPGDTWDNASLQDPPTPSYDLSVVWTGSLMIVWGGGLNGGVNTGSRYDPLTDTWSPTTRVSAPQGRQYHTAVWTGSRMIIWGGFNLGPLGTGGIYDPVADAWTPTAPGPSARYYHTAVWTGTRMVIFGGQDSSGITSNGAQYDPVTNTWPVPFIASGGGTRRMHTAVWNGTRMLVWGGEYNSTPDATGGMYDPAGNVWTPISMTGAPSARKQHQAVWANHRMVVWGGTANDGNSWLTTGGRFDPVTNTWAPVSSTGAPGASSGRTAVSTGRQVIIWGPNWGLGFVPGGRYDPASDTWFPMSTVNVPSFTGGQPVAVWTGNRMIIWGGGGTITGARYDPATDTWTPTSLGGPAPRYDHAAVWSGNLMLVWGGYSPQANSTGDRYDPMTDTWTAMSTTNAPLGRPLPTAVWTGSAMVVWGGAGSNTGGRYNPISDTWAPTSISGAPPGRDSHTAVWTGTRMVIWGGWTSSPSGPTNTGGQYDPVHDTWGATSLTNAPTARRFHTAVWTGSRMIVWGGGESPYLNTGAQYNPTSNQWTATSTTNAPSPRYNHVTVWTGSRMIIHGGNSGNTYFTTGGQYDPVSDTWTATSTAGAPNSLNTAVWTGSHMIVWRPTATGGRYDPAADAWTPISLVNAPPNRDSFTLIWTGDWMIVWGGYYLGATNSGGRYALGPLNLDQDGDGFTACAGDCNDHNAAIHPGATEICNGVDDDCNGIRDDGFLDADADGFAACGGDCNDADIAIHPGAVEVCNGKDDNCNGTVDEGFLDQDGDGATTCTDCNDFDPDIYPGAVEVCNGKDDNCNAVVDEGGGALCPDSNPCTQDLCAGTAGCQHPPAADGSLCSDGNLCTGPDSCAGGTCQAGPPRDADGDAHADALCGGNDCNDSNAQVWFFPLQVANLTVASATPTGLAWDDQGALVGPETAYDLVSGLLTSAGTLNLSAAVCLQSGGPAAYSDTRPDPDVAGPTYWYLARARNSCGKGTYGFASDATERVILSCP